MLNARFLQTRLPLDPTVDASLAKGRTTLQLFKALLNPNPLPPEHVLGFGEFRCRDAAASYRV